jgi:hypothetical protein|tara:strand:- start:6618 stop:7832 length:1215 start_codon:yes stop_codon:yes gene_type:complete
VGVKELKDMTERKEEEDHDEDEKKNNASSSFLSHLNLPEHILSDRVVRRTQARLIARKTVADAEANNVGLNEIAKKRTTRGKTTTKTKEQEKKECCCENELNLISSLKRDLSQANAKSRRLSKMVSTRDEEIEDLKKRAVTLNREKAKLLCEDRVKAIEIGTKEVERKEQEKVLVIPKGLADADAAARETWLKLLRSEDASFVRFARAIRKRENEVAVKEKELCKRKESEALCREQLVKNEKELMRMKIKAERLESEARSGFEASSQPLREEIESVLLSEEKARTENESLKKELEALLEEFKTSKSSLEKRVSEAETSAALALAKEAAKEKECRMLLDLVREMSNARIVLDRRTKSGSSEGDDNNDNNDSEEEESMSALLLKRADAADGAIRDSTKTATFLGEF